jgi:hypothetical protein
MSRDSFGTIARKRALAALLLAGMLWPTSPVLAGGQGTTLPAVPLPVRETELRIASETTMVCVDAPASACLALYLDASTGSTNDDGGTFRSTACPGSGACRPDYIPGAELTGELIVDWPITRTPPDPDPGIDPGLSCGSPPWYKFCYSGHIQFNVTAPGVSVSNPVYEYVRAGECDCFDNPADEQTIGGSAIDGQNYWVPRNVGASCDIALEYSSRIPREQLVAIGQQAFPSLLCDADAEGACSIHPVPVLVEPDGSLTKGCGTAPSNTFLIRFARSNLPLSFVRKPLANQPRDAGDLNGDGQAELVYSDSASVGINDGNNLFTPGASGIPAANLAGSAMADWTDDGDLDLLRPSGGTRVYPGNGDGTFDDAGSFLAGAVTGGSLGTRDLNADDLPDAVSSDSTGARVVWNQTAGPVSPSEEAVSMSVQSLVDFDSDTDPDLLGVQPGSPTPIDWAANSGPGSFAVQNAIDITTGTDELVELLGQDLVDNLECDPYASSCCSENATAGCDDTACEDIVCNELGEFQCCSFEWDSDCRNMALERCGACMDPATPDCCTPHGGMGCEVQSCEDIVCELDSSCCNSGWTEDCAGLARGWCKECHNYNVVCLADVVDVDAADVDGDGDADLCVSVHVDLALLHPNQDRDAEAGYLACIPNLQVDAPQSSSGLPLFDTATAPWQVLGPAPTDEDFNGNGVSGQFELVDLDDDDDPDAVGVGFWYRNEAGSFTGPHTLGEGSPTQGCGVDDLVGYWRFPGDANDSTCDNDGVVSGATPTTDIDGTPNSAYDFDGIDDYIDLGSSPILKPELPVTISAYVKHDCPMGSFCQIFANDSDPTGNYTGVSLHIWSGGEFSAQYGDGGAPASANRRSGFSSSALSPGVWHHVAVVIHGPLNFDIYIDGVEDTGVTTEGTGGPMVYGSHTARVGGRADGFFFYDGAVDELRFYRRALSADEVISLALPGAPLSPRLPIPLEKQSLDILFVTDLDSDGDADVIAAEGLWERVPQPVPEPGMLVGILSGIALLRQLSKRRCGNGEAR